MDNVVTVDLSDDERNENARRKLDRKRFNEIKKYIPFLQYITAKDPVKNDKYVKLLQWFNSNKNLPARVATTCEFAINKRFRTLQSSMVFPPHILSIFEGGGEAIDLVSDDDDHPTTSKQSPSSTENKNNKNTTENFKSTTKENTIKETQINSINIKTNDQKPSTSLTTRAQNDSITSIITVEEGELISDDESVVKDDQIKKKKYEISLSEISLTKPHINETKGPVNTENNDDIINQDLFNRIDSLDKDSLNQAVTTDLSWKDLENEDSTQRKNSPILRPKNIESYSRKSPELIENISDEYESINEVSIQRRKKKKHKHKKKPQTHVTDSYDGSETENHLSEKQRTQDENKTDSPRKPKKLSKKRKEKIQNTRPLYVSDDEDDQSNVKCNVIVESVKKPEPEPEPEPELFKRREFTKKDPISTEIPTSNTITVVLSDSDENEINISPPKETIQTNGTLNSGPILEPKFVTNETTVPSANEIIEHKLSTNLLQTKAESASPCKLKDLNNMGLNELNDIYAKLCEKTGIQLEELLGDLVNKSSIPKNDNSAPIIQHTDNYNNNDITEICYDSYNVEEEQNQNQLQQQNLHHHQQLHQQNIHYQQQQQLQQHQQHQYQHQQQQQQQDFQNHIHCTSNQIQNNPQASYSYQNSLIPRLNLNDPRIVQKLKQIKDSPIHNLSIRESATLLMNCYAERPTYRNIPPPVEKITSSTATTYGEHKRLKELEKQELERTSKRSKESDNGISRSPNLVQENSSEAGGVSPKINSTNKKLRKDSSGSENGQKLDKSTQNKKETQNNSPSFSGLLNKSKRKENPKRTNSSDFESGRKTPRTRTDTDEDDETVVMSFVGRPKTRQRIISSSSSSMSEHLEAAQISTSGNNEQSNIRKVVKIVMSALGQTKEGLSPTPSKSRRNSSRKSTDSTKSDPKTPKPIYNSIEVDLTKDEDSSSIVNKNGKKKTKCTRRKTNDHLSKSPEKPKPPQPKRGCRELENLNCTFKEYSDMFEKFLLPTKDGKRLCIASSSSSKKPESNSSDSIKEKSEKTVQKDDSFDSKLQPSSSNIAQAAPISRRRKTFSALQNSDTESSRSTGSLKVCIRRSSETGKFNIEKRQDTESSDETDEFDIEEHRKIKNGLQTTYKNINKDPFNPFLRVSLERLSVNEINKWVKNEEVKSERAVLRVQPSTAQTVISKNDIDNSNREFGENPILVPINSKPVNTQKKITPKVPTHLNNNINMTLNSTKTCVLCNKRPLDLTNHYVVQHQTESYTSRLTAENIEYLEANITLAVRHRNRYKVTCPFCQVQLEDNFVNFHAHFSYHTGEYGFKCAVCDLVKPYREDIRSHQYRTSTCLNGKIRSNYLYSPDLEVIYLYVCNLCNFVQLNEANIHKHQRDHHGIRFEEPQNLKKCIIAALDNGQILNEIMPTDQEEEEWTPTMEEEAQNLEQEFLDEFPLDIKDVLLTDQQMPSTSQLALFENLLENINIDNEASVSVKVPSPEANGLQQLQAPVTNGATNIMTVIHTSSDKTCRQERHKPYMEPVEKKPELSDKIPESASEMRMVKSTMIYREMPEASKYFGMFKCTINDCWFSSNEAHTFVQHISSIHNSDGQTIILECAYCQYKNIKAHNMVGHVRSKHSLCRFQCAECAYRSTVPGNVALHRKVYHKNSNVVTQIYECGGHVSQLDEKQIDLLQKMVKTITSLKCPDCSKCFYAVSSIKTHIQKAHPQKFAKLDHSSFHELACIHCKEESNNKDTMRMHLALDHPDEIAYVVERKLKNKACNDSIENLNMINISLAISPADVHVALFEDCDIISNTTQIDDQTLFEDAPPPKIVKPNPPEISIVESACIASSSTNIPTVAITDEEKLLRPLLELLTENTGAPTSSLYRCPECVASFLHYDLWRKHITTRHKIINTVGCPYCSKQLSLELAAIHFESHRRHEYICFHCVTSFCSREKIWEHFASFHQEFRSTIEKKIAFGDASFSIFKEKDVSLVTVNWVPLFHKLSDNLRQQLTSKLQQQQHNEWLSGLSASCLVDIENLEIPKYIINGLPRYKCLMKSCPFVGSDESNLDVHMTEHLAPDKYRCSHCSLTKTNPNWKYIKDHKMMHKEELHICCVCKYLHHSFAGMSEHVEQFHKYRDVPVINMQRDEVNYKISLAIVLTEKKMTFTNTDACYCCLKVLKNKLVYHLKKEHKVTLCPKCVICDAVILTHLDADAHAKTHKSKLFKLKYDVLTPYLYKLIITSISPLTFETSLIKEKRPSHDLAESSIKKIKPNEDPPTQIKEEVVIKTECPEIVNETPSVSIKCVNLQNLMQDPTSSLQPSVISVQPISDLIIENHQEIQSESIAQCHIPNYTPITNNTGLILPQNIHVASGLTVCPYPNDMQIQAQLPNNLINPQISLIERPQTTTSNQPCISFPELAPICGNCNFECSDFLELKIHFGSIHAYKNERFLFRVARRVECLHCCFRCSVLSLSAHYQSVHPNKIRMCRSIIDSSRCGLCHETFKYLRSADNVQPLKCACPRRQRLLADCLDINTLRLLQGFGQNCLKYICDICNMSFNNDQTCRQHIVQIHKKANYPKLINLESIFVCFRCEEANTSITNIIEHINKVHFSGLIHACADMMPFYRQIKIIYPKGLTLSTGDLRSTHNCHGIEALKQALQQN